MTGFLRRKLSDVRTRSFAVLLVAAFTYQCGTVWANGEGEFFESKIRPLLARHCYECHSTNTDQAEGGLQLDHVASILSGGDSGPAVNLEHPSQSLLWQAVQYLPDGLQMPPIGKLSDSEIGLVKTWIESGGNMPADTPLRTSHREADLQQAREFWSFRPLEVTPTRPLPPHINQVIDAYVQEKLTEQGVAANPPASRRHLIRRLAFDLTGLPPKWSEVHQFVNDQRPDAYLRLVDRYLAVPQFGERWGRFWLDLARYTDTTASWLSPYGNAYLYRDWVTSAVNDDLPYDQFVKRQLATDMMSDTSPSDLPALGFLGLSPSYWKELRLAPNVIRTVVAEEWEERINTIGRTFLGLTIACARCHDHKFDPITTKDYYAFAGVLASTRLSAVPLAPKAYAQQVIDAQQRLDKLQGELDQLTESSQDPAPSNPDPSNPDPSKDERRQALETEIEQIRASTPYLDAPWTNAVEEASLFVMADGEDKTKLEYVAGEARNVAVQIRGNPANAGEMVPRRYLQIFADDASPFTHGSGRLELANAMFRHSQSLAARVIVNRIWMHHFGHGLVSTPSNFGAQGEPPTHPELLDYLASELVRHHWSTKWLHRAILLSDTYQRSSRLTAKSQAVDPDNRWLWKMNRRRLSIEAWRDTMLAVTNDLDQQIGGPALDLTAIDNQRRTLYATINRRDLDQALRLHDFPDPTAHHPKREPTVTALQQLYALNSDYVLSRAVRLGEFLRRVQSDHKFDDAIQAGYRRLFSRSATQSEIDEAREFISSASTEPIRAWQLYAQVLLTCNELQFID